MATSSNYAKSDQAFKTERKRSKKMTYGDYIKQEMSELIEKIELTDLQRRFMKSRWLDQLLWMEGRSTKARNRHYTLRLITIIGGVIVPALVSANSVNLNSKETRWRELIAWTAFGISQAVAISAAVEELFHYGENYRRYRNSAEGMKIEAWQFFQLSGHYRDAKNHSEAYVTFAANIENIIQQDVEGYISQSVQADADSKVKAQAAVNQNLALANMHLREQMEISAKNQAQDQLGNQSNFGRPSSTTLQQARPGFNLSAPALSNEEGEEEFLSPAQLQNRGTMGAANPGNAFGGSLASLVEDEEEFVTPSQIGGTTFGAPGNGGGFAPNNGGSSASLTPNSPALDEEFVTPTQINSPQFVVKVNPTVVVPTAVVKPTPPPPPPAPPALATPEMVADILECPLKDTQTYLPGVLAALQEKNILDKPTLIAALATIRVETGGFCPINEFGGDSYFTENYEGRDDLGNFQPGDGARYHGRGFIQITGRANYRDYGQKLGLGKALEDKPELALDPKVGARILACYFDECNIPQAARDKDWRKVRRLVNGGYNGWEEFDHFVQRALQKLS